MELTKIIEKLETLATRKGKIFLGGSYALKYFYDIFDHRPYGDIDVIVYNFNQAQFDWIKDHFEIDSNNDYVENIKSENKCSIFYFNALHKNRKEKINFIVYSDDIKFKWKYQHNSLKLEGLNVLPLKAIIDAKLEYSREKDKSDFFEMQKSLFTPRKSHLSDDRRFDIELPF
jgi:hypothetical protein